jgi:hypothetical protein
MVEEDYATAVGMLHNFIVIINMIPEFDRLILDYLKGVSDKYTFLFNAYKESIDREVEEKATRIFHGDHYKTWLAAKNGSAIYEKLRTIGRKSNEISKKKSLWYTLLKQRNEEMAFTLYSGKK